MRLQRLVGLVGLLLAGCTGVKVVPPQPIHNAALWGNPDQVQAQLSKGVDINTRDAIGRTPLLAAAGMGHAAVVELLVKKGADVNARDRLGKTALGTACWIYAVHVFQGNKAASDAVSGLGGPLPPPGRGLSSSSREGQNLARVASILLAAGADVNLADRNGRTPLDYTVTAGWVEGAQGLLAKGAHVRGITLPAAMALGLQPLIDQVLAKKPDVNTVDAIGMTALDYAAGRGSRSMVELLLARGAKVGVGKPLVYAAANGNQALVAMLLAKGASPNRGGPLAAAAARGHLPAVRLLLEHGADVNGGAKETRVSPEPLPPLARAAEAGHLEVVRLLIEKGANVNCTVRRSLFFGPPPGAILLVSAQVTPAGATVEYEMTPRGLASENGHREVADLLRDKGGKSSRQPRPADLFVMPK